MTGFLLLLILITIIFDIGFFVFHALEVEKDNEEIGKQLDIVEKELVQIKLILRNIG